MDDGECVVQLFGVGYCVLFEEDLVQVVGECMICVGECCLCFQCLDFIGEISCLLCDCDVMQEWLVEILQQCCCCEWWKVIGSCESGFEEDWDVFQQYECGDELWVFVVVYMFCCVCVENGCEFDGCFFYVFFFCEVDFWKVYFC